MATKKETGIPIPSVSLTMGSYEVIEKQGFKYPGYTNDKLVNSLGWDKISEMLNMSACRAPLNAKRYAVMGKALRFSPAVTNPKDSRAPLASEYCEMIQYIHDTIITPAGLPVDARTGVFEILRAFWEGFRVAEIGYRYIEDNSKYNGLYGLSGIFAKEARQIGFTIDNQTASAVEVTSYTPGGIVDYTVRKNATAYDYHVPIDKLVIYTVNPNASLPFGDGDWRACYRHYWSIDVLLKQYVMALETWGMPMLIAKGNPNNLDQISDALNLMRSGARGAFSTGTEIEALQSSTGIWDGYDTALRYHNNQIATNVLGNILSISEGGHGATSAGASVHQDTGKSFIDFARLDVEAVYRKQVIDRLCRYNIPNYDQSLCPHLSLGGKDDTDIYDRMQSYVLAIQNGIISPTAPFIRQDFGWPAMDDQEAKEIEDAKQAEIKATQMVNDAKQQAKTGTASMSDYEAGKLKNLTAEALIYTANID